MKLISITTTQELIEACAALSSESFVTVDTEFLRETTYYPKLCLIQIAGTENVYLIDTLSKGLDLTPFFEIMANTAIVKVFHSARQDIEIIYHLGDVIPTPLFDSQVAAMVCGFGDQASYETLVNALAGAKVDKSSRFTDWARRPLTDAQIKYAAADVSHLRVIYLKLLALLEKNGRASWLDQEMSILNAPSTYRQEPATAWQRLRLRTKKPVERAILIELAAWRELEAQNRDVPRARVLKDEAIGELCVAAPRTTEDMGRLRALPQGYERSAAGQNILAAVARGIERAAHVEMPPEERSYSNGNSALMQLLKVLLQATAENANVASKLIATVDDLIDIAENDTPTTPALIGWRGEVFGASAMLLKQGKASIGVEKGRVALKAHEA